MTVSGTLTWLGGGRSAGITEGHERSGYLVTGLTVILFALVGGVVVAAALLASGDRHAAVVTGFAVLAALIAATIGRALATRKPGRLPDRLGLAARIGVAVLAGLLLAELAATVLFGGTVDRLLDDKARDGAATSSGVLAAGAGLDAARTERDTAARAVDTARTDIDNALVVARCEFNPTPECPSTRITGVPGRGPEARTADAMLEDARTRLTTAQDRVTAADSRVAEGEQAVSAARAAAFTDADRGLGARWLALHEESTRSAGVLLLRLLTLAAFVLLALLPLIMRWWRGETSLDRHDAYRAVKERAEIDADTTVVRKRAEVRAESETLRAERELESTRLAVEADAAIDRERQRTRIIAAIGGIELGVTEPRRLADLPAYQELPAADRKDSIVPEPSAPNLPATVDRELAARTPSAPAVREEPKGGLELPIIGQVPFSDTAARWIRPLVPSFVANAIDTATHPLRTARQAFEEVEEITFTLRRTRRVTVDTQDSHVPAMAHPGAYHLRPGSPEAWHAARVAAAAVDPAGYVDAAGYADPRGSEVEAARREALAAGRGDELTARRGPRELPPSR